VTRPDASPPDGIAFEALGDAALLLRFGDSIDPQVSARVLRLQRALRADAPHWVRDVVPAYASLALHLDPDGIDPALDPVAVARDWVLARIADADTAPTDVATRCVEIAVRYGGSDGPDLDAVAAHCGLTPRQVIERHAGGDYRVAMLGFAPGFPYLLGLDPALTTPRLAQPRLRVEAGSVAIGGAQTGIYPRPGPGGWHVIGSTEARLFDPAQDLPSLLQPGDRVRFVPQDPPA
jgi:KipI family sensor histidine kinase inhibitor